MAPRFVIARNRGGRPTLQHVLDLRPGYGRCGVKMTGWSRFYSLRPIPELLCYRCKKAEGLA